MDLLAQLLINGVVKGAIFALIAVSFGLVFRCLDIFHIVFGALFVLSGFTFFFLHQHLGVPLIIALLLNLAVSVVYGLFLELFFYGQAKKRNLVYGAVLVCSLGLGLIIQNLLALYFGNETYSVTSRSLISFDYHQLSMSGVQLIQLVTCLVLILAIILSTRTRHFKVLLAMQENHNLIEICGWPLSKYRLMVMALSTGLASIPASLVVLDVGMDVHDGMTYLFIAVVAVIAGGVNQIHGWIIAGFVLSLLHAIVAWQFSTKWVEFFTFILFIIVLAVRREGIIQILKRNEES